MAAEAAEVLHEWRRAERLLAVLPDDAPERPDIELRIEQLRDLYQHVTGATIPSPDARLEPTERQIDRARIYLDGLTAHYSDEATEVVPG
jgi:hypothetical protein